MHLLRTGGLGGMERREDDNRAGGEQKTSKNELKRARQATDARATGGGGWLFGFFWGGGGGVGSGVGGGAGAGGLKHLKCKHARWTRGRPKKEKHAVDLRQILALLATKYKKRLKAPTGANQKERHFVPRWSVKNTNQMKTNTEYHQVCVFPPASHRMEQVEWPGHLVMTSQRAETREQNH